MLQTQGSLFRFVTCNILLTFMLFNNLCSDELDTYNSVDSEEEHYTVDDDDDGYGNDQF